MRRVFIGLLVLVAVKIAILLARGPAPIIFDASGYWELSSRVMQGDLLLLDVPIAYRTPIYPWFLAVVRLVSGGWQLPAIIAAQGLLYLATVLLACRLAVQITGRRSAAVVALLITLPAVAEVTYASILLSETLFTATLMLQMVVVADYARHGTWWRAVSVGVVSALSLLTRPITLLLWIPHLVFLGWIHFRSRRGTAGDVRTGPPAGAAVATGRRLQHLAWAAVTFAVLIAPWVARNQVLFGRPFLTEFVGRNLWIVTFQPGSGAGLPMPETEEASELQRRIASSGREVDPRATWQVSRALVAAGLRDDEADRLMKAVAFQAVRRHPVAFGKKAVRRTINYWRTAATDLPQYDPASTRYRGQPRWSLRLRPVEWVIDHRWSWSVWANTLALLVIVSASAVLLILPATRPHGAWLALTLAYFSVVTGTLEIPDYRYRMVVEPLAVTAVASAAVLLWGRWRKDHAQYLGPEQT